MREYGWMQRRGEFAAILLITRPSYVRAERLQSGYGYKYQFILVKAGAALHFEAIDG